jgi:uncharacterized hydrophobic protein (TIGR00271 family)
MFQQLFRNISEREKANALKDLFRHSAPSKDFFLMSILSVIMATFGLLTNSAAVIIGSMLIAPILYPTLGLAMGIIMSDFTLIAKSFATLTKAVILGIVVAAGATLLFASQLQELTPEIIARTKPSLLSVAIGVIAGFAAAFAMAKPKLNETLPGIAISVALVPPLAVVGIGLARLDIALLVSSLHLFIINALGVIFAAATVFSLMNFYGERNVAENAVKKEEREIKKEEKKGKKIS